MQNIKYLRLNILMALLILFVIIPWSEALARWGNDQGWHMGPGIMGALGMGGFGRIFMIVFWVLFLVGLVFFIKWLIGSTGSGQAIVGSSRAHEILRERYARGEIDQVEFEAMKMNLSN
jgi:putative membrane protein